MNLNELTISSGNDRAKGKHPIFNRSEFLKAFVTVGTSLERCALASSGNLRNVKDFEEILVLAFSELKLLSLEQGIKFIEIQKVKSDEYEEYRKFQKAYLAQKNDMTTVIRISGLNNGMSVVFYSLSDNYVKEYYGLSQDSLSMISLKQLSE